MRQYDPKGVWDRVQSAPAPEPQSPEPIMEILAWESRVLQHLSKKLPPPQAAEAREQSHRFRQQLACLRGMQALISGTPPRIPTGTVPPDPPDLLLRQCYAQTLRLQTEYEARRGDPAYGHIFRLLAHRLPEQSGKLLELLGM